jgi:hypothetical protein
MPAVNMPNEKTRNLWISFSLPPILILMNSYYVYNLNGQIFQLKAAIIDMTRIEGIAVQNKRFEPTSQWLRNICS